VACIAANKLENVLHQDMSQAMAEDVIAASVASGERSLTLQSLSLHALPDSLYSLAGLDEVNLEDNFIVPSEPPGMLQPLRTRHTHHLHLQAYLTTWQNLLL
jgi:hypothetical protein